MSIDHVSEEIPYTDIDDLQALARTINRLIERFWLGLVTLSGTSTEISDSRITANSTIFLTPTDSSAQAVTYYATYAAGTITITHDATGTFDYLIIG